MPDNANPVFGAFAFFYNTITLKILDLIMKTTPFTEKHIALGAKMHEFAGYNMPIEYPTGIINEHFTVCG